MLLPWCCCVPCRSPDPFLSRLATRQLWWLWLGLLVHSALTHDSIRNDIYRVSREHESAAWRQQKFFFGGGAEETTTASMSLPLKPRPFDVKYVKHVKYGT